MHSSEPFLYEPRNIYVTGAQAADLVTHEGADDHDFLVNPLHESPDVLSLFAMLLELKPHLPNAEAHLLFQCIADALLAAGSGVYGVAAILAAHHDGIMKVVETALNQREHGNRHEFTGHAEMRLIDKATPYLQARLDHSNDVACVNLCPCPGCFGHMIDAHFPKVIIGSIDPQVGAAFLRGQKLQYAAGAPRMQVIADRGLTYSFPNIPDQDIRSRLMTLAWEAFHTTRQKVHQNEHAGTLRE